MDTATKEARVRDAMVELLRAETHLRNAEQILGEMPGHRDDDLAMGFGFIKDARAKAKKGHSKLQRLALLWRATS